MMEDKVQLEKILSYMKRQQCIERILMAEDEEDYKKMQEIWRQKVWRGYVELKDAGFKEGQELFLTDGYEGQRRHNKRRDTCGIVLWGRGACHAHSSA